MLSPAYISPNILATLFGLILTMRAGRKADCPTLERARKGYTSAGSTTLHILFHGKWEIEQRKGGADAKRTQRAGVVGLT